MGVSDAGQSLVASFAFGIVLLAAAGALLVFVSGHGSTLFKDSRRLALVLFLLFAALWALVDFLNLLTPSTALGTCQIGLSFSTAFDELARLAMEQYLAWSMGQGRKMSAGRWILQGLLAIRLIAGGVFVAFTRPQFAPVCVARTSLMDVSILVLALDIVIIGFLIVQTLSQGMMREIGKTRGSTRTVQSKALVLTIAGFSAWTATSVPMLLGISSISLILRTALPVTGLLLIIVIIMCFQGSLLQSMEDETTTPEATSPSPFVSGPRTREIFNNEIGTDGSPIAGPGYDRSALFVVNPTNSPRDNRGDAKTPEVSARELGLNDLAASRRAPGYRGSSGVFPVFVSSALANSQGSEAPVIRPSGDLPAGLAPPQAKRPLFQRSNLSPNASARKLGISQPMAINDTDNADAPFTRMPTIDLQTAAENERERRTKAAAKTAYQAQRPPPAPPLDLSAQDGFEKSVSLIRKAAGTQPAHSRVPIMNTRSSTSPASGGLASTTSASFSPGREEVRRRSPRTNNNFDEKSRSPPTMERKQTITGLPSNPRAMYPILARESAMVKEQTVLYINDIVYDNPEIVTLISRGYKDDSPNQFLEKTDEATVYKTPLKSSGSIIHRPRPYKRITEEGGHFPMNGHQRSKSGSSLASKKSAFMSNPTSPSDLPPLPKLPCRTIPTHAEELNPILPYSTMSMTFDEKLHLMFPAPPYGPTPEILPTVKRRSSVPELPRQLDQFMEERCPEKVPIDDDAQVSRRTSKQSRLASFGFIDASGAQEEQAHRFSVSTYRDLANEVDRTKIPDLQISQESTRQVVSRESQETVMTSGTKDTEIPDSEFLNSGLPAMEVSKVHNADSDITGKGAPDTLVVLDPSPGPFTGEDCGDGVIEVMLSAPVNTTDFLSTSDAVQALTEKQISTQETPWHRRIGDELPTFSARSSKARSRKMPPPTPLLLNSRGKPATFFTRNLVPSPPELDSPGKAIRELQDQLKHFEQPDRGSVDSILQRVPEATTGATDRFRLLENLEKEMGLQESEWQRLHDNVDRNSMASSTASPLVQRPTDLSRQSSIDSSRPPSRMVTRRERMLSKTAGVGLLTSSSDNLKATAWQQRLAAAQNEFQNASTSKLLRKQSLNFLSLSRTQYADQLGSPTPPDSVATDTESEAEIETVKEPVTKASLQSLWKSKPELPQFASGRLWNFPYESSELGEASPEPPAKCLRPYQRRSECVLTILTSELWSKPNSPKNGPVPGLWGAKLVTVNVRPVTQRPQRQSRRATFLPDILESPRPLPNKSETLGIFQFPWGETSDSAVYRPAIDPLLAGPVASISLETRSRQLEMDEYSSSFMDDDDDDDSEYEFDDPESDDEFDESTLWEIAGLLNSSEVPSTFSLLPAGRPESVYDYDQETEVDSNPSSFEASLGSADTQTIEPLTNFGGPKPITRTSELLELVTEDLWQEFVPDLLTVKSSDSINAEPSSPHVIAAPAAIQFVTPWMWEPRPLFPESIQHGLFSIDAKRETYRSTNATPAAIDVVRGPRQFSAVLPTISSRHLFQKDERVLKVTSWMMMPSTKTSRSAAPDQKATTWTPPETPTMTYSTGLFTKLARVDNRRSEMEPAALHAIRKQRTVQGPLARLTTRQLWSPLTYRQIERDWISESSVRPSSPSLYSPLSSGRSSPTDHSDASSVKSASTKASSIWTSMGKSMPSWLGRSKKSAKETAVPIAKDNKHASKLPIPAVPVKFTAPPTDDKTHPSKLPILKTVDKQNDTVMVQPEPSSNLPVLQSAIKSRADRGSKVFSSRAIFEAKTAPTQRSLPLLKRETTSIMASKPVVIPHKPIRFQARAPLVFRADWDHALDEAILAGFSRPTSSPADWDAALATALALSKPGMQRSRYSASARGAALANAKALSMSRSEHPKTLATAWDTALAKAISLGTRIRRPVTDASSWDVALAEAVSMSTDFQTISEASRYNPAVLHPVFFTEYMVSDLKNVHPAAIGHVQPVYDQAVLHPVFFTSSLVSETSDVHPAAIGHVSRSLDPAASSTQIERPGAMRQASLTKASPVLNVLWSRALVNPPTIYKSSYLWSKHEAKIQDMPSLFAMHRLPSFKKAKTSKIEQLPRLQSASLFKKTDAKSQERNWIESCTKEAPAKSPGTWVATVLPRPAPVQKGSSMMWSKNASQTEQFSELSQLSSRKAIKTRSESLPKLTSTELFTAARVDHVSEHSWIQSSSSRMVTSPSLARPPKAADGLPRSNSGPATWVATEAALPTENSESLWSSGNLSQEDLFSHVPRETARRASSPRSITLSALNSSEMWILVENDESSSRDWLNTPTSASCETSASASDVISPTTSSTRREAAQTWTKPRLHQSSTMSPMWTVRSALQPSRFATIVGEPIRRGASAKSIDLPDLQSSELWTASGSTALAPRNWLMMCATTRAQSVGSTTRVLAASKTWSAPPQASREVNTGGPSLWSVNSADQPSRFENSGLQTRKRSALRDLELPILESQAIWKASKSTVVSRSWLKEFVPYKTSPSTGLWTVSSQLSRASSTSSLWTPASAFKPSLFEVYEMSIPRVLVRKVHELPVLESSSLWPASKVTPLEARVWLIISPTSVPVGSAAETWSPPRRMARTFSKSSLWSANSACEPLRFDNTGISVRKASTTRALKLPILDSNSLWTAASVPKPVSTRDWLETSDHAVGACSVPKEAAPILGESSKATASPKIWTAASVIAHATDRSHLWSVTSAAEPSRFTLRNDEVLRKAAAVKPMDLPILESSTFWTSTSEPPTPRNWLQAVVPSSGPVVIPATMWTSPKAVRFAAQSSTWSKNSATALPRFENMSEEPFRKAVPSKIVNLSVLQSTTLWARPRQTTSQTHWLSVSAPLSPKLKARNKTTEVMSAPASPTKTWNLAPRIASPRNESLWTKATPARPTADMFTFIPTSVARKSPTTRLSPELPQLSSSELFQVSNPTAPVRNWLLSSQAEKIPAQTWTASLKRSAVTAPALQTWTSSSQYLADMFSDPHHGRAHIRQAHEENASSSFPLDLTLWTKIAPSTSASTNWLVRN